MMTPDHTETGCAHNPRAIRWIALGLAAVTLAVFWRATACGFINYDDPVYVTQNLHVQKGLTADSVRWAFTSRCDGLWVPLTMLSHMLDWQLYRDNPAGHHLTNVLLHTANTLLLFLLLRRMTGSMWRSAFVAALFALHPLHAETVAWISERKGALGTLLWLLTLYAYTDYARFRAQGSRSPAAGRYAVTLVCFACALMAKPIAVTLPFLLLLLDYWPLERWKSPSQPSAGIPPAETHRQVRAWRRWGWLTLEKVPFLLLTVVFSVVAATKQPESFLTLGQRGGNAMVAYPRYLWKTLWPASLAMPYPFPRTWGWPIGVVILAAVLMWMITHWVIRRAGRQPWLVTGWFWFVGTLVPVLGLIRMGPYSMADRYTYVSLIGIFIMAAWAAGDALSKRSHWKPAATVLAGMLLCLYAWRANYQTGLWTDSGTLFSHTIAMTREDNYIAQNDLGYYLQGKGRYDEAIEHYDIALAVKAWPNSSTAWNNRAIARTLKERQEREQAPQK
jgi:protein O-mannosyl-transferase